MPGLLDFLRPNPGGGMLNSDMQSLYRRQKIGAGIRNIAQAMQALSFGQPPPAPDQGPDMAQFMQMQEYQRQRQAADAQAGEFTKIVGGLDPRTGITWDTGRTPGQPVQTTGGKGQAPIQPSAPPRGLLDTAAQGRNMPPALLQGILQAMGPEAGSRAMLDMTQSQERYEPITDAQGNIVGQRSTSTGRAVEDPRAPARESAPPQLRLYNEAVRQGYRGNINQWLLEQRKAGATNVTVGGGRFGTIPSGYELRETPEGAQLVPIPGGEAATKAKEEAAQGTRQQAAEAETGASKAATMLDATSNIKKEFGDATMPVVGTASIPFALYSGTSAGRVRSYVNTLKSGVVLGAMLRLKDASKTGATGFGQMNKAELQVLIDNLGSLDPDNTEKDIFLRTVDRIEGQYKRVVSDILRNVSPERIKELGLEGLLENAGRPDAPSGQSNPYTDMTDEQVLQLLREQGMDIGQ